MIIEAKKKEKIELELRNKIDVIDKEKCEIESLKQLQDKQNISQIATLKSQLIGAVRRINYLIDENKKLTLDSAKHNNFTSQLEFKILQQSKDIDSLKTRLRQRVQSARKPTKRNSVAENTSQFKLLKSSNKMDIENIDSAILKEESELVKLSMNKDMESKLEE